ncbi:hypothetical protein D9M71_24650 [compost metagenome]
MSPQYKKKFLVRPLPLENEFILSYLERLKEANVYLSINSICTTMFEENIILKKVVKGDFNRKLFSQYTGISLDLIDDMCIFDERNYYCTKNVIFCPICFDSLKYIRKNWYQKEYLCPIHFKPLISKCIQCNYLISWNSLFTGKCFKCQNQLNYYDSKYFISNIQPIDFKDIFNLSRKLFRYKLSAPYSSNFNLSYLVSNLNYVTCFINNLNGVFDIKIRNFFFNIYYETNNPEVYVISYLNFIIDIEVLLNICVNCDNEKKIKINLKKFIPCSFEGVSNDNIYNKIGQLLTLSSKDVDYKKYLFVSKSNCANILNINLEVINQLCERKILKKTDMDNVDLSSFFRLCMNVSKSIISKNLDSNYIYFYQLPIKFQVEVISYLYIGYIKLYNFNIKDVFEKIQIHRDDLKYLKKNFNKM